MPFTLPGSTLAGGSGLGSAAAAAGVELPHIDINAIATPLGISTTSLATTVRINNSTEFTIRTGTLRISDRIEERTRGSVTIIDLDGDQPFLRGYPITIRDHTGAIVFNGAVWDSEFTQPSAAPTRLHNVTFVDWHYLLDKHLVADTWEAEPIATIVANVVTDVLAAEGITIGLIKASKTLDDFRAPWINASQVLDRLAALAGNTWWLDHNKRLYFVPWREIPAPFTIEDGVWVKPPKLKHGNNLYRNVQYLLGAEDTTAVQTDGPFTGDGETKTFLTGFRVAKLPVVEVNRNGAGWVAETVGHRGLVTGRDWYWAKREHEITQDDGAAALTNLDQIRITYQGVVDIVVQSEDAGEIAARQAIEGPGTTGRVEAVDDLGDISGRTAAFDAAGALLLKYAQDGKRFTFTTDRAGLAAGHVITVDLPSYDLDSEEFLITAVNVSDWHPQQFLYQVTAVQGPVHGSWEKLFERIAKIRRNLNQDATATDQTVSVLAPHSEGVDWSESVNVAVYACHIPSPTLILDASTILC